MQPYNSDTAPTSLPPDFLFEALKRNVLFHGIHPDVIAQVAPHFTVQSFRKGDVIFTEASAGRELYVVLQGSVRIEKHTAFGVDSILAQINAGDYLGELSALDGLPRSARAEALTDCLLASAGVEEVRALVNASADFSFNILRTLSTRLRTMDQSFMQEIDRNASDAKAKLNRLQMLVEASKKVNSVIEIDKLLDLILEVAVRSIQADRGTLYLIDRMANELWSTTVMGNNMVQIRLPIGKGLAGYVAQTGETVNIPDAYQDARFNPDIDRKSGYTTSNVLCMPMRDREGTIVGVFQFLNKTDGVFSPDDEAFIDGLSVHAAIALENARLARQMVESERLSAVGRMASTIIHDIKNPMGTLRLYAQVIKRKIGDSETARLADEIIRQIDRFVTMTQEILDFSRGISAVHLENVSLGDFMGDALTFIADDLRKKNIELLRKFDYTGLCKLDIEKMVRVFYNLSSNAADAMKDGGTLSVMTRAQGDMVLIEFTDTGTGIPDDVKPRVFEPFFTYGKKEGTGLGLAIVRKIIDDHGGKIQIESELNKGTTIRISIPLHTGHRQG